LIQIEAAKLSRQTVVQEEIEILPDQPLQRNLAGDGIGERMWLHVENRFDCTYKATVKMDRAAFALDELSQSALKDIPRETIKYLMPSRYCHLEQFERFASEQFSGLSGGALVLAVSNWLQREFTYDASASNVSTAAHDTLAMKRGVCRDYAHVMISVLRALAIPARMVSGYAPRVTPQDFHAVVEVFLDGDWYLIDPTGMANADEIVIIGVGRDAADISFLTSYGFLKLEKQSVRVTEIGIGIDGS
jgi:transglutaminase-like putative cysteine protease